MLDAYSADSLAGFFIPGPTPGCEITPSVPDSYVAASLLGSAQLAGFHLPGLFTACVPAPGSLPTQLPAAHWLLHARAATRVCCLHLVSGPTRPAESPIWLSSAPGSCIPGFYRLVLQHSVEAASPYPVPRSSLLEIEVRWLLSSPELLAIYAARDRCNQSTVASASATGLLLDQGSQRLLPLPEIAIFSGLK